MSYLRFQVVIFGLTFVAATFLVGVDGVCNKAEFQKCAAIMSDFQKPKITYTREVVEASCRVLHDFNDCANRMGCVISEEENALVKRSKETMDYLCGQRLKEAVDAEQCLDRQKLFPDFCHDKAMLQPGKTPCETGCLFISCAVQYAQKCCGKTAGDLVNEVFKSNTVSVIPNDCQFRSDLVVEVLPLCITGDSNSV